VTVLVFRFSERVIAENMADAVGMIGIEVAGESHPAEIVVAEPQIIFVDGPDRRVGRGPTREPGG
jgi:hypothetical protein